MQLLSSTALAVMLQLCLLPPARALYTVDDPVFGAAIYDPRLGTTIQLKGVNWFGFNNGATMVESYGLSNFGGTWDFAAVVYRMQALGMNAVRLPFSFQDLSGLAPKSRSSSPCTNPTTRDLAYSVGPQFPANTLPQGLPVPPAKRYSSGPPNTCNQYYPVNAATTYDRFVGVVEYFADNDFYVIIDDHTEDETVEIDPNTWVTSYANLVAAITLKLFQKASNHHKLIVDVLNEPDARGWGWDKMSDLYLNAMDAIYTQNNEVLFLIEGCGQGAYGASWGDGFQTDNVGDPGTPSNPNGFFKLLGGRPYKNQVAVSPHVYPPSVTGASTYLLSYGTALYSRLSNSFGYLARRGYDYGSAGPKRFPVVIGEVGSRMTSGSDTNFLTDFPKYLAYQGDAQDGSHKPIPNVLWWSWNANSGDTGGLVDDSWYNLIPNKVNWLQNLTYAFKPWYAGLVSPNQPSPPRAIYAPPPSPKAARRNWPVPLTAILFGAALVAALAVGL